MTRKKKSTTTWAACKAAIKDWPVSVLLRVIQDLYKLSPENRRFLHSRLFPQTSKQTLTEVEKELRKLLSATAMYDDRFSHAAAKRVVDQFAKAASNEAVAHLLVSDLEMSLSAFSQVGDYDPAVNHIYATLNRLHDVVATLPDDLLLALIERMNALIRKWGSKLGYGIGDELTAHAAAWNERVI